MSSGSITFGFNIALWEKSFATSTQAVAIQFELGAASDVAFRCQITVRWILLVFFITIWMVFTTKGHQVYQAIVLYFTKRLCQTTIHEAQWTPKDYAIQRKQHRGTPFQYQQLDPLKAEIRLAQILPGSYDDETCIHIFHASLFDRPRYTTLSYTWGAAEPREGIVVNGHELMVNKQLATALSQLRRDRAHGSIPYWIDALCINQADTTERSQQVRIMTQIYEQATIVTVWLGMPTKEMELAFAMMRALEAVVSAISRPANSARRDWAFLAQKSESEWNAITKIFENPYFTRVWVAQEISNPFKRNVEFIGGRSMQRFSAYGTIEVAMSVAQLLTNNVTPTLPCIHNTLQASQVFLRRRTLRDIRYRLRIGYWGKMQSLVRKDYQEANSSRLFWRDDILPLLAWFRRLHATDPRDKVFAAFTILIPHIPESYIDYRLTMKEVYKKIVINAIANMDTLDVLAYCDGKSHDLPSWVPDWRRLKRTQILCASINTKGECIYTSSLDRKPRVSISGDELQVEGIIIDTIDQCSERSGPFTKDCQSDWLSFASQVEQDGDDIMSVYQRVLVADCERTVSWNPFDGSWKSKFRDAKYVLMQGLFGHISDTYQTIQEEVNDRMSHWRRTNKIKVISNRVTHSKVLDSSSGDITESKDSEGNFELINETTTDRRLCRTKAGALGIAPDKTQPGDTLVVLIGAKTPFVLRQVIDDDYADRTRYELIGECYFNGWMDGKALILVKNAILKAELITLI